MNNIVFFTFPGVTHEVLYQIHQALEQSLAVAVPDMKFIVMNEEMKVTDLDKLQTQLSTMLGYVEQLQQHRSHYA
jgi:hypothetical protein